MKDEVIETNEVNETNEAIEASLTFADLGLCEQLQKAAAELGFEKPTPVQAQTIPQLLSSNDDLVSLAQTGTGKTAAFGFPILDKLFRGEFNKTAANTGEETQDDSAEQAASERNTDKSKNPKVLILSPTRELCKQIAEDLERYAMFLPETRIVCVYGGSGIVRQMKEVKEGADIIVATPGRILDLCKRKVAHLDEVSMFVLDEADQMLDMGFKDDLDAIVAELPQERQTLLFSATMPVEVENIAKNYTRNYKSIVVGQRNSGAQNVRHFYVVIKEEDRYLALKRIVDYFPEVYGIIFCRTKLETQEIAGKLMTDGYDVDSIHGDLTQDVREQVMKRFKDKTLSLLVATDVAARGIDVDSLTHVINYKLPDELEIYTHRSGRTGRADKEGQSIIIANSREMYRIRKIEKMIGKEIRRAKIPGGPEICKKQIEFLIDKLDDVTLPVEAFPYLPILEEKWKAMTRDQIIKKFLAVTANRFLEYYKNAPDLNYIGATDRKRPSGSQHGDSSEKPSRSRRRKYAEDENQEQGAAREVHEASEEGEPRGSERGGRGRRSDKDERAGRRGSEERPGRRGREERASGRSGRERGRREDEGRSGRRGRSERSKASESGRGRSSESKGRKRGETISEKQDRKWYEQFVSEVRESYSKDEKPRKRKK
ncbi:MAG: DEAD/DEAH box helicase [Bacteroidales bacterium]|nr:DEAD/DEAH box helicase [Candidatus Egerieousia equi]